MLDVHQLPDDVAALKQIVAEQASAIKARDALLNERASRIAVLEAQLAVLKRRQFGQSSEKLGRAIAQLELALEELREDDGFAHAHPGMGLSGILCGGP